MIKLRLKEYEDEDPNSQVGKLLTKFSKYLEDEENIYVTDTDYSTKTVYVDTIQDLKKARHILRTEFSELKQKGCHVQSSIGADGLNKDYIDDTETQTESLDDDFEQYTYVKSKEVYDSDGWRTEYTMYYDEVNDRYVFVFGDSDFYDPNDGYEEFDWECDTEREADEWFDSYNGFDDDLDESFIAKESSDIWDVNTAAKQSADAALKNIKQGIEDFEIEINTKVDRPNFWKQFRKEMTENGLDFEIKGKDTEWDDHYYYMYLYMLNDDLDESIKIKENIDKKHNWFLIDTKDKVVSVLSENEVNNYVLDTVYNMLVNEELIDEDTDEDEIYSNYMDNIIEAKYSLTKGNTGLKTYSGNIIIRDSNYVGELPYGYYLDENGDLFNSKDYCVGKVENCRKEDNLDESICNEDLRYYVTDDDYIPLKAQPDEGYTKLQAIQRAQREAEQDAKLFKMRVADTAKWYHIMDSNNNILYDLDTAI